MDLSALARVELSDAVVERIRDAILRGQLAPGEVLPGERELAVQLGVNRTTVREGLSRLEHLGLIERRQGARVRVLDHRRSGSLELLPDLARLGDPEVGASILEAVGILYEGTAALAAERATAADVSELERLATAVEVAADRGDVEVITAADRAFQHGVAAAAHSVALELTTSSFYRALDATLDQRGGVKRAVARMLVELRGRGTTLPHRRLAEAVAAHDPGWARAVAGKAIKARRRTSAVRGAQG